MREYCVDPWIYLIGQWHLQKMEGFDWLIQTDSKALVWLLLMENQIIKNRLFLLGLFFSLKDLYIIDREYGQHEKLTYTLRFSINIMYSKYALEQYLTDFYNYELYRALYRNINKLAQSML